jgi:hypothetical protein
VRYSDGHVEGDMVISTLSHGPGQSGRRVLMLLLLGALHVGIGEK